LLADTQAYLQRRRSAAGRISRLYLSWQQFYRTYDKLLRRFAASLHLEKNEVDEVVQMVWCQLVISLPKFKWSRHRRGLPCYLYVMLRNKALDLIRDRKGRRTRSLSAAADVIDPHPPPLARLEEQFQQALVATLLAELKTEVSELNFRVFYLHLVEGRSVEEVAATLALEPEAVWSRCYRVLRKLRLRVKLEWGDECAPNE
jgi:RNA polymerase sigma factor (sigma-70 family)